MRKTKKQLNREFRITNIRNNKVYFKRFDKEIVCDLHKFVTIFRREHLSHLNLLIHSEFLTKEIAIEYGFARARYEILSDKDAAYYAIEGIQKIYNKVYELTHKEEKNDK